MQNRKSGNVFTLTLSRRITLTLTFFHLPHLTIEHCECIPVLNTVGVFPCWTLWVYSRIEHCGCILVLNTVCVLPYWILNTVGVLPYWTLWVYSHIEHCGCQWQVQDSLQKRGHLCDLVETSAQERGSGGHPPEKFWNFISKYLRFGCFWESWRLLKRRHVPPLSPSESATVQCIPI